MKPLLAVAVSVFLSACGGSTSPLSAAFAGTWTTNLSVSGGTLGSEQGVAGELDITVSGSSATVAKVCLDGTGSLSFTGSGDSASYSGLYACGPATLGSCASAVVSYASGTASVVVGSPDTLTIDLTGNVSGCGQSSALTAAFTGLK
jgi:hypothetical protein